MIYQNANSASAERYKEANNEAQIAISSGLSTNQKKRQPETHVCSRIRNESDEE